MEVVTKTKNPYCAFIPNLDASGEPFYVVSIKTEYEDTKYHSKDKETALVYAKSRVEKLERIGYVKVRVCSKNPDMIYAYKIKRSGLSASVYVQHVQKGHLGGEEGKYLYIFNDQTSTKTICCYATELDLALKIKDQWCEDLSGNTKTKVYVVSSRETNEKMLFQLREDPFKFRFKNEVVEVTDHPDHSMLVSSLTITISYPIQAP